MVSEKLGQVTETPSCSDVSIFAVFGERAIHNNFGSYGDHGDAK